MKKRPINNNENNSPNGKTPDDLQNAFSLLLRNARINWSGEIHLLDEESVNNSFTIDPITSYGLTLEGLFPHTAFTLMHFPTHGDEDALNLPFYQAALKRDDWHSKKESRWTIFQQELLRWLDLQSQSRLVRLPGMETTAYAWFFQEMIQEDNLLVSERTKQFVNAHARINREFSWWCPLNDCVIAAPADTPRDILSQIRVIVKAESD